MLKKLISWIHRGCQEKENFLKAALIQLRNEIRSTEEESRRKEAQSQKQITSLTDENRQLKEELALANAQLKEVNQGVGTRDRQIASLTAAHGELRDLLQTAREEQSRSAEEASTLQTQLQEERAKAKDATQSILALRTQVEQQEEQIAQATQEQEALQVALHNSEQTEAGLRATIERIEQEKFALEQEVNRLKEELDAVTAIITPLVEITTEDVPEDMVNEIAEDEPLEDPAEVESEEVRTSTIASYLEATTEDASEDIVDEITESEPLEEPEKEESEGAQTIMDASLPDETEVEEADNVADEAMDEEPYVDTDYSEEETKPTSLDMASHTEDDTSDRLRIVDIERYEAKPKDRSAKPFDLSALSTQQRGDVLVSAKDDEEKKYSRTITVVEEVETGERISVEDIFSKSRAELMLVRKRLQEAIMGLKDRLYVCPKCKEKLTLAGDPKLKRLYFRHLPRSKKGQEEECPLRVDDDRLSRAEIDALKYSTNEGERHRLVKETLAELLKQTPEVERLYVEKNVTSEIEGLEWKRPDIQFEYRGRNIICELQISSIYLSVITERDLFYRVKQHSVLWVFCFEKDSKQAELEAQFVRDIYYANRRNAFIFTKEAYEASKASNRLHLTCVWFEPHIKDGVYDPDRAVRRSKLVTLDDLSFDADTLKPYYVDAEALFAPYNRPFYNAYTSSYELSIADIERAASVFMARRQARNKLRLARLQQAKAEQDEARELLATTDMQITLFEDRYGKWGYKVGDVVVEPATYSLAELYEDEELILLYKGRRYQFIDYKGVEVGPIFHERFPILNGKCFIRIGKEYHLLDLASGESTETEYKSIEAIDETDCIVKVIRSLSRGHYEDLYVTADGSIRFDDIKRPFVDGIAPAKKDRYWGLIDLQGRAVSEDVEEVSAGVFKAKRFGKWGLQDEAGNEIYSFILDEFEPFEYGIARVKKNGDWGCINLKGEEVIPFVLDELEPFENGIAQAKKGDYWGYINQQGEVVIPFEYERIEPFENGIVRAKKRGYWGEINLQGEVVIPFEYESIEPFQDGVAQAKKNGNWGCINLQGEVVIPLEYQEIKSFVDGIAPAKKGYYWGYINQQGEVVIPFEYDELTPIENGIARVKKDRYWGYINLQSEVVIPLEYQEIKSFVDGIAPAKKGYYWGYINQQGEVVIPFEYESIEPFQDGVAPAKKGYYWGYINQQGEVVIPFEYESIEPFQDGVARAKKNGGWGLIDLQGKAIREDVEEVSAGVFKAKQFGKWGLQDEDGNEIYPFVLNDLQPFENGIARVKEGGYWGKWGCINQQGEEVIPFEYESIEPFQDGVARVKKGNYWGYINQQGEEVIPIEYESTEPFQDGIARVKKNGDWGCINLQGEEVIPFEYVSIKPFENGIARAKKGKRWGCINQQGEEVIPFEYESIEPFEDGIARATKEKYSGYHQRLIRWGGSISKVRRLFPLSMIISSLS